MATMGSDTAGKRYKFGVFEADAATGELRRKGVRVRVHAQPFQVLLLLLERPGELLTREEISRELWPDGRFVDFEHGVNSAVNRLREALGDRASQPHFVETLARRGYRFLAPVESLGEGDGVSGTESPAERVTMTDEPAVVPAAVLSAGPAEDGWLDRVLARPEDLPHSPRDVVRVLFLALQVMYLAFYVGTLANLPEVAELLAMLPHGETLYPVVLGTAALLIPVRMFLLCAVPFRAPELRSRFLKLWPYMLIFDLLWANSPFLLLHHISFGLALACVAPLVYAPFAQRSLVLMGAADTR